MSRTHDYDAAWKSILEVFEVEVVELLFPELFVEIDWEEGIESLDNELREIQKDIFDKSSAEKVISDKIIKVKLKDKDSKILFIHVEVQSSNKGSHVFGERMFRYFYRIWDRFKYKKQDESEIVVAALYTYKGKTGKDKRYVYRLPQLEEDILIYNFRTIDIEKIDLENISDDNPLKLVFKMAKKLLKIEASDEEIFKAKMELAEELKDYDKVKNNEQIKALVDFLEYLFLIEDPELERKFEEYKNYQGGAFKMTIEEIRKRHYTQKGREEGIEKGIEKEKLEVAEKMLRKGIAVEMVIELTGLDEEKVIKIQKSINN